jgi:hypothetical protein
MGLLRFLLAWQIAIVIGLAGTCVLYEIHPQLPIVVGITLAILRE